MNVWRNKDIKLFLVLIPIINLVNYFITYNGVSFNLYFFLTLLVDTIQGYLTWLIIRTVIIKMEEKSPLIHFSYKRLFLQLIYTCLAGLAFIIIATEILNAIAKDKPVPLNFYQFDIWIYSIWILVVNGIYIGMYYYLIWESSEKKLRKENLSKTDAVSVKMGNKTIKIALRDIFGFYAEDGITYILDNKNKSYILDTSLDKIEQKLPPSLFFRINRKFILHRNAIDAFKRIENNKLLILTSSETTFPTELLMSREKAPSFKKWFEQNSVQF